ncbi:MAG: hypothetical protein CMF23_02040 [Ignavibacteriae bacterium]|nr:hypothetical protein [Ignavibacteriota bacterium]
MHDIYIIDSPDSSKIFTLINIAIVFSNLLLGILINFFLFKKRRAEDRIYNSSFKLYETLVLNEIGNIFAMFSKVHELFNETIEIVISPNIDTRTSIQDKISSLYHIQEKFTNQIKSPIKFFSIELYSELNNDFEIFFNETTIKFTRLAIHDEQKKNDFSKAREEFLELKEKNLEKINNTLKKYLPNP